MTTFLITIIVLALIFDFINGFHDAANSIATIVSTKVLTPFQAVLWAAIFNFVAFFIFKDHGVADTVAKTVHEEFITLPVIFAGLIAAITWNLLTWWFGIPSSSSHTLIGGFAGAGIAHAGFSAISSSVILKTASFIILAPLVGMIMALIISLWFLNSFRKGPVPKIISLIIIASVSAFLYFNINTSSLFLSGISAKQEATALTITKVDNKSMAQKMGFIKGDILTTINGEKITSEETVNNIWRNTMTGTDISYTIIRKEKEENITTQFLRSYDTKFFQVALYGKNFKWILLSFIVAVMACFTFFLSSLNANKSNKWFRRLQLVSSAAFSIGHGGNDAQKVMGIITAALVAGQVVPDLNHMPMWVPLACYSAIAAGTMSGGWKIVKTMGTKITKVTPFEGVAAETAGAITLFITEALKIPVSTTHTITGSIIGVGATKRLSAVRWGVTVNLLWAWILTIPVSGLLAAGVYEAVSLFF
jgi:PiT family inorganic phosphate transporter